MAVLASSIHVDVDRSITVLLYKSALKHIFNRDAFEWDEVEDGEEGTCYSVSVTSSEIEQAKESLFEAMRSGYVKVNWF